MKSCRDAVLVVVVVAMLAAVALVAWVALGQGAREMGRAAVPTRRSSTQAGRILVADSGRSGEDVSPDFNVPASCPRQTLAYEGTPRDDEVSWAVFRVIDDAGDWQDSVGPVDFIESEDGTGLFSLDPGRYVIEIEAYEAEWRYTLKCR